MLLFRSCHRDLLRSIVVLAVVRALVQAASPASRPPAVRSHRPAQESSRDLELSPDPAPADCVLGTGSAPPADQSESSVRRSRQTRRGRRAPGARHRGSRGGRRRSAATLGSCLTIGLINIQSLKPKLLELADQLHNDRYDLMGICETWLRPSTPSRLLMLPGYRLCRADRPDGRGFGGVALAARDGLSVSPLNIACERTDNSRLEMLWTLVRPDKRRRFVMGVAYRPPRHRVADIEAVLADLESQYQRVLLKHPSTKIVICGDMNCDMLKSNSDPAHKRLSDFISDHSLSQHVRSRTYCSGSLLDVFLTSCNRFVKRCVTRFCDFSPHRFIRALVDVPRHRLPKRVVKTRSLRRINVERFHYDLVRAEWDYLYAAPSLSVKWDAFLSIFMPIVDCHAPIRTVRIRNVSAPVVGDDTKELMCRRREALRSLGHSSHVYKDLNRAVRSAIRRDTSADVRRRIQEGGRASMWRAVRSVVGGRKADRAMPDASADQLNQFFVSVGPRVAGEVRDMGETPELPCRLPRVGSCSFRLVPLTLSELRELVFGMSGSSACGEDGVTMGMLRLSFDAIGGVFLHLLNSSLTNAEIPDSWKHSLVFPIHKSGDPSDPSNFRPISIVPVFAKIVERAVHQQLYSYLSQNHLLSPTQHGFRRGHSTETALISITDQILSANDRGDLSLLCLLDLSKCFDVIDHQKLLTKLQLHGVDTSWFSAYLHNHTQSVSFTDNLGNTKKSLPLPNSVGIFQGSALGPLLYCVFANDLSLFVEDAVVIQYADDTQILVSGKKSELQDVKNKMEQVLASLDCYFRANGLKVNAGKTQLMLLGSAQNLRNVSGLSIKFRDHDLLPVSETKNLGLIFDRTLSWDGHISTLTNRCFGTLHGLSHLRNHLPPSVILVMVQALVLSQVRYCISVYGKSTQKNSSRIQKIINYAAKVIFGRRKFDHVSDLLENLGWLSADQLTRYHSLCLLHKVRRSGEPEAMAREFSVSGTRQRSTRQSSDLTVPQSRTNMGQRRFRYRAPCDYNSLPHDLTRLPPHLFAKHLRRHLLGAGRVT